jgi:hypothetical protein
MSFNLTVLQETCHINYNVSACGTVNMYCKINVHQIPFQFTILQETKDTLPPCFLILRMEEPDTNHSERDHNCQDKVLLTGLWLWGTMSNINHEHNSTKLPLPSLNANML